MTFDYSFKSWKEDGNLSRELVYFQNFKKKYPSVSFVFLSYGKLEDTQIVKDIGGVEVIPVYNFFKYNKNKIVRHFKSIFFPFKLSRQLKSMDFDVIKQNQLQGVWVALILKFLLKKPLITRTGYDALQFKIKERKNFFVIIFYYIITQLALWGSNLYTVTSLSDKYFLKKYFLVNKNKIKLRPNFVQQINSVDIEARAEKIISVGRLETQKNINFLISEFKNTDVIIDHYGKGSNENKLKLLSSRENVNINFYNNIENSKLLQKYTEYKYFISTSLFEGNPKNILEAMAAGCIVLAPKISNVEEIITDNKDGILFELEDGNLINSFKKVKYNKKIHKLLSNNAVATVKKRNSLNVLIDNEYQDFIF